MIKEQARSCPGLNMHSRNIKIGGIPVAACDVADSFAKHISKVKLPNFSSKMSVL